MQPLGNDSTGPEDQSLASWASHSLSQLQTSPTEQMSAVEGNFQLPIPAHRALMHMVKYRVFSPQLLNVPFNLFRQSLIETEFFQAGLVLLSRSDSSHSLLAQFPSQKSIFRHQLVYCSNFLQQPSKQLSSNHSGTLPFLGSFP